MFGTHWLAFSHDPFEDYDLLLATDGGGTESEIEQRSLCCDARWSQSENESESGGVSESGGGSGDGTESGSGGGGGDGMSGSGNENEGGSDRANESENESAIACDFDLKLFGGILDRFGRSTSQKNNLIEQEVTNQYYLFCELALYHVDNFLK